MSRLMENSRTFAALAKAAITPPVLLLQQATPLSNTAFRVVAAHAPSQLLLDENAYNDMIMLATDKQFRLLPDSLMSVKDYSQQIINSMIIEANTEVLEYDETYIKDKMRVMSANVFVDDSDQTIWRVVGDGVDRMLVQSVHEDFAELLNARLARRANQVVASANYIDINPENGDYIEYYNAEAGTLSWGFAVNTMEDLQVFDRAQQQLFKITAANILAAADGINLDNKYSLANRIMQDDRSRFALAENISPSALSAYVDYMRTLFAGTDYFAELEKLIRQRRGKGPAIINTIHD
jgi:hypothetical protein